MNEAEGVRMRLVAEVAEYAMTGRHSRCTDRPFPNHSLSHQIPRFHHIRSSVVTLRFHVFAPDIWTITNSALSSPK